MASIEHENLALGPAGCADTCKAQAVHPARPADTTAPHRGPSHPELPGPNRNPLNLQPIATHPTSWRPSSARVALNISLDACIVPDATGAARVDKALLVVLDDFIGEQERLELLDFITRPGWDAQLPPPGDKWERATRDRADAAPTWGLRDEWLRRLASTRLAARLEVQSRLQALYPDYLIAHMPSDDIQTQYPWKYTQDPDLDLGQVAVQEQAPTQVAARLGPSKHHLAQRQQGQKQQDLQEQLGRERARAPSGGVAAMETDAAAVEALGVEEEQEQDSDEGAAPPGSIVDCNQFVANAAMYGDSYSWHVDADPSTLPFPSTWTREYGQYVNREPGRPLFVSLLLYLNRSWESEWDAETLFLDTPSDCGVVVRPKAYRAVLMDQDILHRLSPPSRVALGRPRYSLVWKLVMLPRKGYVVTLARKAWGRPTPFGSAATLERVVSGLAAAKGAEAAVKVAQAAAKEAGAAGGAAAGAVAGAVAVVDLKLTEMTERKKRKKRKKKSAAGSQGATAATTTTEEAAAAVAPINSGAAGLDEAKPRGDTDCNGAPAVAAGADTGTKRKKRNSKVDRFGKRKKRKLRALTAGAAAAAAATAGEVAAEQPGGGHGAEQSQGASVGQAEVAVYNEADDGGSDHDMDASGAADAARVKGSAGPMEGVTGAPGSSVSARRRRNKRQRKKAAAAAGAAPRCGDTVSEPAAEEKAAAGAPAAADGV